MKWQLCYVSYAVLRLITESPTTTHPHLVYLQQQRLLCQLQETCCANIDTHYIMNINPTTSTTFPTAAWTICYKNNREVKQSNIVVPLQPEKFTVAKTSKNTCLASYNDLGGIYYYLPLVMLLDPISSKSFELLCATVPFYRGLNDILQ